MRKLMGNGGIDEEWEKVVEDKRKIKEDKEEEEEKRKKKYRRKKEWKDYVGKKEKWRN